MPGDSPTKSPTPTVTARRFTRAMQVLSEQIADADAGRTEELEAHALGDDAAYYKAYARTAATLAFVRRFVHLLSNGEFEKVERELGTNSFYGGKE